MPRTTIKPTADDIAHFLSVERPGRPIDQSIKDRIVIERAVVRHAATALVASGLQLRLHDGETWATAITTNVADIMGELGACDEESLYAWEPSTEPGKDGRYAGKLFLVYGNDGWDVIADHSVALEGVLQSTYAYAESLS